MIDFVRYETLNGGSLFFYSKDHDLQTTESLFSYVYNLILGGNVEASTTGAEQLREKREDFWGNYAFYPNTSGKWINSSFERTMNTVELSSNGRIKLEQALNSDLARLKDYGTLTAEVSIISNNKIQADIELEDVGNFTLTWDATIDETILTNSGGSIIDSSDSDNDTSSTIISFEFSPSGDYEFSGDLDSYNFSD